MNWQARRKLTDMVAKFIYISVMCATAFVGGLLISKANASSFDNSQAQSVAFKAGDLITLPNRKGNFIMLLWGGKPIFYNGETEWFQEQPIRNYQTVYLDVTRMIPEGDYQFVEIDSDDNPWDLHNWRWIREYKLQIVKCDQFKFWNAEICKGAR